ncbi:phosphatase PAP2 family protein [Noviherbaspirillum sp. Root189]|uniref:phosphatase PAP2 family protein n=1 Tax=Noviherbaspirillum sp. Root189 TaxID=1736487 RepID=UPI00070C5894|nr:phosphatase PAP2 family protein [Noviherbaspirillum sp. Root189]KRB67781.1 hypothetical protein ASE07_08900 [Noviherbaspirillum sp. Root189]
MTRRSFLWCVLALLLSACALLYIGRFTDIDLRLADAVFDVGANDFPWRENWFFASFMHHEMKAMCMGVGMVPVVSLIADSVLGNTLFDEELRRRLLIVVASAILIPLTISTMKGMSVHHCPWSLQRYGGFAPYLRILADAPPTVSNGHCFPAGHASSGLWIASVAVFWLPRSPQKALIAFVLGLLPGLALGLAQQIRGAHFLTHTLWSVWITALIILILSKLLTKCSVQEFG